MKIESNVERNLLELFKEFNKNRIDYNVRKWETIKFFESIFTALIVSTMGGIITAAKLNVIDNTLVMFGLLLLPLCAIFALFFGIKNLNRESRLLYIEEATMFKILILLDLPEKIPENKRWIPGDEFLLPPKYRDYKYGINEMTENIDFDGWLNLRAKKHRFSFMINLLFVFEIIVSALIMIGIICIYYFG
ncbi:MAG: hypothetical protein GXO79_04680 [Chlorobi bacterium]|nr:hypothetical protein [Chlorobiota bacterium]